MAYSNNGYGNRQRKSNYSYQGGNNSNNGGSKKKHSGAKSGTFTSGSRSNIPYVQGWNYSRSSRMVSILASPYKGSHQVTSKAGRIWQTWIAKVTPRMAAAFVVPCLYDVSTGKVIIQALGLVMNPKGGVGGYCGKFSRSN